MFENAVGWVLVAACVVFVLVWIWRVIVAARRIAHRPAVSVEALNLHDASVGRAGAACGVISYFVIRPLGVNWWPSWAHGGEWLIGWAGAVTVVALIVMELRWPVPGGTVRTAALGRRRIRDIVPRAGAAISGLGMVIGIGAVLVCGIAAWLTRVEANPPTPDLAWPGWAQTLPLSMGLVVMLAAIAVAAWVLVRRSALAGMDAVTDLAYRRAAMDRILRVGGVVGFLAASAVTSALQNIVMLDVPPLSAPIGIVLAWQAAALIAASLVSVRLRRAKLPRPPLQIAAPAVTPR